MSKMKRRLVSLTLVAAMFFVMAIPASARASDYITSATIVTNSLGNGKISMAINVVATGKMQEIGATQVIVNEKGADGKYKPVYTFTKEKTKSLISSNRTSYMFTLTYQGTAGKDYYITAQCYAKNASGSGTTWAGSKTVHA